MTLAAALAPIIVFASGTVGDTIHSRNGAGPYTRPHVNPVQPNTMRQTRIRNRLGLLSVRWGDTVTEAQRDSWKTYAANVSVPSVSGRKQFLTAQQMYIRCNMPRGNPFQNAVDDAPVIFSHGRFSTPTVETLLLIDFILVLFTGDDTWQSEDGAFMIVQVSDGQSLGTNFFAGPFREAGRIPGDAADPPTVGVVLNDPFVPLASGPRWARVRVSRADGRLSPARIFRFLPIP